MLCILTELRILVDVVYFYGFTDSGRCCVYLWTYDFWLMLCIFIELRILVRVVYIYRITDSGTCCVY